MTRTLSLVEYLPQRGVRLTVNERDELTSLVSGLTVKPEPGSIDLYTVTSGSTVGIVHIGDLVIELQPKVGPAAVLFMLSYELDPRAWRQISAHLAADATLTEAVAALFVRMVGEVARFGLLHDYRQRDDTLSTIRGRVRMADQIRVRSGLPLPTEVTYDEYTPDIVENRILRSALDSLRRLRLRSKTASDALVRLQAMFAEVSPLDRDVHRIPEPHWTRLNERYRSAVNLARLILTSVGLEARAGLERADALLIDMNAVFERFLRVALREALALSPSDFPSPNKIPRRFLDRSRQVPLQPDMTWWRLGECVLVADCKYKRPTGSVPNADVYQMLAYLSEFELDQGWLVYASGEVRSTDLELRADGKVVHVREVDAAKQPAALLGDVQELAAEFGKHVEQRQMATARLA